MAIILAIQSKQLSDPRQTIYGFSGTKSSKQAKQLFNQSFDQGTVDSPYSFSVGPKDARVTVVEFIDYLCPYSRQTSPAVRQLMNMYKDASVRFVIREMPLVKLRAAALPAAEAMLCAKEQGKYLELHDVFFLKQELITPENMPSLIREAGLDYPSFEKCFIQSRYHQFVVKDLTDAQNLGLYGTPTFFINSERIVGAASMSELQQIIDRELRK